MIVVAGLALAGLLLLVSFVQLLSLEAMRLRSRDSAALEYFKQHLQQRLGADTDQGTLAYSLAKHTLLVATGAAFAILALRTGGGAMAAAQSFAAAWLVMLAFSYIGPQLLYRRTRAEWVEPLIPFLKIIAAVFRPLTAVLKFLESLFEIGSPPNGADKPATPGEEIEALISAGEEEGIIEKEDSRLIQSVVAFGDKRVREVMTPRPQVVWIDVSRPLEELRQLLKTERYSRIPIGEGGIDRLIGFVHVRDLYELDDEQRKTKTIRELMREIEGVPETKPVPELLREMQTDGRHIVYVVNEYGNVAGIATLEDLFEEVFGEIFDEHEPARDFERGPDGSITLSGSCDVDRLEEYFGFRPAEGTAAATVGGLVTEWLGAVPEPGTVVRREGLAIEVLAADGMRVESVRIRSCKDQENGKEDA
jgi:CBS domain containing-hemolysin-like protein